MCTMAHSKLKRIFEEGTRPQIGSSDRGGSGEGRRQRPNVDSIEVPFVALMKNMLWMKIS